MGTLLPAVILWVLVVTHITHLHGSPMRGQRVYGREFLRIRPVTDSSGNTGLSEKDTITNRQQRTRQDNSKIDPDIGDNTKTIIISQLTNKTNSQEEQRGLSLFRSSSFSRSLRRPWYKDSRLPVSSHTSQEAVRRRLPANNPKFDTNKSYPENRSPDQLNSTSNRPSFNFTQNYSLNNYETDFSINIGSSPSQNNIQIDSSLVNSSQGKVPTEISVQGETTYLIPKNIPSQKLHIESINSRIAVQNNQRTYTTIRNLLGDTTTFSPLTTEVLTKREPKSTTEFVLYPVSDYEDYYYPLDDETQLMSTTDETAVTDPYISQESVTEVVTETIDLNNRKSNGTKYNIYSNAPVLSPISFIASATDINIQLYNNSIKLIPRNYYSNTSPSSTTVQFSTTSTIQSPFKSTTPITGVFHTRRPSRRFKYTTPSLELRQRLLANRFRIRQFSSERKGRMNNLNSQDSKEKKINRNNRILNNKQNIFTGQQNISYVDKNDTNSIDTRTPKLQENPSKNLNQNRIPSLPLEDLFEVKTQIETNLPEPSPLHLLTDPLIVEVNRGPILKHQDHGRNKQISLQITEQPLKENTEVNSIHKSPLLDNNDTFIILPPKIESLSTQATLTETPTTTLQEPDLINITTSNQYDTNTTKNIDTTIINTESTTDELDIDTFTPLTNNYELQTETTSSTMISTIEPSTTQEPMKMKTKEETKASWEAQSRSLSTSAVRKEVRTTEHEVHVKIYEKLPTPAASTALNKMIESLERLKNQQGVSPFGSSPFGTNPGGTSAFGLVPQGHYPQGRNPLGLAALQQTPSLTESTTSQTTITTSTSTTSTPTTSTSTTPNITESNSQSDKNIPEPNVSKFQLERKTKDGFIIGEYGVLDHDKGNVNNGVRYTAEGNVDPKLIHDALQLFLSL